MLEIVDLYEDIWNMYGELWLLELQGNKNSDSFRRLIDSLRRYLKREDELFSSLIRDYEYDYDKIIDMIMNSNVDNDDIRKRMYDYVVMYEMVYSKNINNYKSIDKLNRLYMSGFRNMYLLYFSYLEEFIDKELDDETRRDLLNLKYMEVFYNHDMEIVLLMNDFSVPVNNYVDLDVVDSLVNLSNGMDEVSANYIDIILGLVVDILDIRDNEYSDNSDLVFLVKNQCMFRACLALISEEQYMMISDEIYKIIKSNGNDNNKISVLLVKSIIDMRMKDRERVRRLSLKK